ncbi:MAG: DinB family protein [Ramlibacter sp.]
MDQAFIENFRLLARYNRWFNQRLYQACGQLSDDERKRDRGAFFGSIHNTLNHLVWADCLWLKRLAGQGVEFASLVPGLLDLPAGAIHGTVLFEDWRALQARREQLDIAIEECLHAMPQDFPLRTVRYANMKGVEREHAAWIALTHFFNHQAHHRGQVTALLSQAGVDPGVTDLIAMV